MLTDVGALGLSLLTAWIARRPANDEKTYGYQRWEILAALVNGTALFGIAGWVVVEAVRRIGEPPPVRVGLFLGVAVAGLAVNLISLRILHGTHRHNLNTRGAYLHILGDVLGSVGAIAAAVVIGLTGWRLADPLISIAIALLILIGAFRLVRESTEILLEAVPKNVSMSEVQRRMLGVAGVTAVHDLHVWTVTSGLVAMSGHAVVPELTTHPDVLEGIRSEMAGLGIRHVTIQLEVEDECAEPAAAGPVVHRHGPGHSHPHPH
jgi:cobalt-zinc-cadmium efflux system protein